MFLPLWVTALPAYFPAQTLFSPVAPEEILPDSYAVCVLPPRLTTRSAAPGGSNRVSPWPQALLKLGAHWSQGQTHRWAPRSSGTLWPCGSGVTLEHRESRYQSQHREAGGTVRWDQSSPGEPGSRPAAGSFSSLPPGMSGRQTPSPRCTRGHPAAHFLVTCSDPSLPWHRKRLLEEGGSLPRPAE